MDKTDYYDKMNVLVSNKQTYNKLKRDPTPSLQRRLKDKLSSLRKTNTNNLHTYYRLKSSVPRPPKLYELPKIHKPQVPMRPTVSFCGSPTYQLSKYLTTILQPLANNLPHKLQSTETFIDVTKTVRILGNYKLVLFNVKSQSTSIPLELAPECTETASKRSTDELLLPTEDIMQLLTLCLRLMSTYFQYNCKHYKQLHGTAMGSPVSVVVAEIVMQSIEQQALATYGLTLPFWFRYVDDIITTLHDDNIDQFHNHISSQNRDIHFTKEIEKKGTLPFLDCFIKRDYDELRTTVYRKPTHTDRLLDELSYNPTSHKAIIIKTLTRHSPDSLPNENE